jgi:pimeloyl-ACP methyl ester carboxylesterase
VLIGLGVAVPYVHRGERGGRWRARVVAVVLGVLVVYLLVMPVGVALWVTHRYREPVADMLEVPHENVTLHTKDGLDLAAWWIPAPSGDPAILVLHGGGGDRSGAAAHADMLARDGFAVLLWDERGRGESEGQPDALGWTWGDDVDAALDFLEAKGFDRVGVLGLSTGADVFLEAAAHDKRIDAVVADGATIRSVGDVLELPGAGKWADLPYWASTYGATSLFLMARPGPRLADLVGRIAPRPLLLISTGVGPEHDANRVYRDAARMPVELWELPGVGHTGGLRERPQEYEARVTRFFDSALASRSP